jgi:hypothetical protein
MQLTRLIAGKCAKLDGTKIGGDIVQEEGEDNEDSPVEEFQLASSAGSPRSTTTPTPTSTAPTPTSIAADADQQVPGFMHLPQATVRRRAYTSRSNGSQLVDYLHLSSCRWKRRGRRGGRKGKGGWN